MSIKPLSLKQTVFLIVLASFISQFLLVKLGVSGTNYKFLDGVRYAVGDHTPIRHDWIPLKKCFIIFTNAVDSFLISGLFWYYLFISSSRIFSHHVVFLGTIYLYYYSNFSEKYVARLTDSILIDLLNFLVFVLVIICLFFSFSRRGQQTNKVSYWVSTTTCVYFIISRFLLSFTNQFVSL